MYNGMLSVYKEAGFTSHDVVAKLRGILRQKKIGHTGTLDPAATGVLPICLGSATKLCDMYTDKQKEYLAVLRLGITTDTQDTTGVILKTDEVNVTVKEAEEAIMSFQGSYGQIPPMYSAVKIDGKRLYELARQGKEVERKPRLIQIHEIRIECVKLPQITMRVRCSKGTYIRTLCHDIGEKLGCGAAMAELVRTRSGDFILQQALKLCEVEKLAQCGEIQDVILPVEEALKAYNRRMLSEVFDRFLYNGNPVAQHMLSETDICEDGEKVRMCDSSGRFLGLYEFRKNESRFFPVKMFMD